MHRKKHTLIRKYLVHGKWARGLAHLAQEDLEKFSNIDIVYKITRQLPDNITMRQRIHNKQVCHTSTVLFIYSLHGSVQYPKHYAYEQPKPQTNEAQITHMTIVSLYE